LYSVGMIIWKAFCTWHYSEKTNCFAKIL